MGAGLSRYSFKGRRRGIGRAAVSAIALSVALLAGGCGGEETTDAEKAADAELLNEAMALELTAAQAYAHGGPLLRGEMAPVGRQFRAHAQEHVSAITKALRGLGTEAEAEAEELEYDELRNQADFLSLAYELENAALAAYLDAAAQLEFVAPRMLAASLASSHAQHLVILRQGLGASPMGAVPEALEPGDAPAPPVPTGSAGLGDTSAAGK